MNRYFALLLFLIVVSSASASNPFRIEITGVFPGAEGREIRVMEYGDLISYRMQEIDAAIIDDQGRFSIGFSRFEPQFILFRIDHARMGMFVEPGKNYVLEFDQVDFDALDDRINPYLNPWRFPFRIIEPEKNLNAYIDQFEEELYGYLSEHFVLMQLGRNVNVFENFIQHTDSLFNHIDNEYFQEYYRYKYAYYRRVANLGRFEDMLREYILNQPVLYNNTQYMNLFNTVFDKFIFAGSRRIPASDLRHTVNRLNSYHALMDSLGKDTILRNEVLRELVMLKGLQDMYNDPDYLRSNVVSIIEYVEENSRFPQHRVIARNILHQNRYLRDGIFAPSVVVKDHNGNQLRIPEDFEGKYLYLVFWASWCETCILDFIALQEIYSKHNDNLAVIGISSDRHLLNYETFIRTHNHPWEHVHFNSDFRLLDAYQVRTLPSFVLIDREGRIRAFPARRPSEDLITYFEWLLFQERRSR